MGEPSKEYGLVGRNPHTACIQDFQLQCEGLVEDFANSTVGVQVPLKTCLSGWPRVVRGQLTLCTLNAEFQSYRYQGEEEEVEE